MMRALTFDGTLQVRDVPCPVPQSGEALLKVRKAGICNTDLELMRGYKNFRGILGHEFVADVIEGSARFQNQRVVSEINIGCGECKFCRKGIPSQCRNRSAIGIIGDKGAFSEYLCVPEVNLHIVPEPIPDHQAVFTEPLAAACQVLERAHIKPDTNVVLIGAGKLGLLCAQVVKLIGADLSCVIRHDKQKQLLEKWGIKAVMRSEIGEDSAEVVIDCTGTPAGFADALEIVEPRGTIVLKSTYEGLSEIDLTQIAVDEISVIGSRCGSFPSALRLLEQGLVDVESLIDATYSLADGVPAMEFAAQKGVLKVLFDV